MKRMIAMVATAAALTLALCACGGGPSGGNTTSGGNTSTDGGNNPVPPGDAGNSQQATTITAATLTGTNLATLATDGTNLAVLGQISGASQFSDLYITKIDAQGTTLTGWPVSITAPAGSTNVPRVIKASASHVATLHNESPSGKLLLNLYNANGTNAMAQINLSDNADAGDIAIRGDVFYSSRVKSATGNAAHTIFKASTSGALQVQMVPAAKPQKLGVDSTGVYVAGDNDVVKYDANLTAIPLWSKTWSTGTSPVIHDLLAAATYVYVAGSANGHLVITAYQPDGIVKWSREYVDVVPGVNKVHLGINSNNELCMSVGGKFGKFDHLYGNVITTIPVDVPNSDFTAILMKTYFVSGDTVKSLNTGAMF